jgi:hypothetical protein
MSVVFKLFYSTLIKSLLVFGCVAVVLGKGLCEIVIAREVLLGAEVEIVMVFCIQHSFDG